MVAAKRAERWKRIVLEASKQSRRVTVPEVAEPLALKAGLDQVTSPVRILLSETEQTNSIAAVVKQQEGSGMLGAEMTHALAIGPEGGWAQEEMALFTQYGWQHVTLGPRILRAETAAIAAIAILSSHLA